MLPVIPKKQPLVFAGEIPTSIPHFHQSSLGLPEERVEVTLRLIFGSHSALHTFVLRIH